jgi:tetratricopeptide (TPR) repeat protein
MVVFQNRGLQMAIILRKLYQKCKFCLLFALTYGGCQPLQEDLDKELVKTCLGIENEIRTYSRTDSAKAIFLCQKLETMFPRSDYAKVITHIGYAEVYERWGEKIRANHHTDTALMIAKKRKFYREEAYVYLQKFDLSENYEDGLEYLQKFEVLQKSKNIADPILLYRFYFKFGYYYHELNDKLSAQSYFQKSLEISRKNKLFLEESNSLNALSMLQNDRLNYTSALTLIDSAITICNRWFPEECGDHYFQKAIALFGMKRYDLSEEATHEAQKRYTSHPKPYNPGIVEVLLGDIYVQREKYKEAEKKYLIFLGKAVYPSTKIWAYNKLSRLYSHIHNYKDAWMNLQKLSQLKDSVYSNERGDLLLTKRTEFKLYEQEQQFKEKEMKYRFLLFVAISAAVVTAVFLFFIYRNKQLKTRLSALEQEKLQQEVEFEQRKVAASSLQLTHYNDLLKNVKKEIDKIRDNTPQQPVRDQIKTLTKSIENNLGGENEWDKFKLHFEAVSPYFFGNLKKQTPALTDLDLKHCAYLKLNLTPKQVARILGINPKSVTLSRVRIKKKIQLPENVPLGEFLQKI